MNWKRIFVQPIAIALSPNITWSDIFLTFRTVFWPFNWRKGRAIKALEDDFKRYLGLKYAFSFASGREALYVLLKAMGVSADDEVLLQAYTCSVVPNSIIWLGAKPIYVDIEADTFNMDPEDLARKITSLAKVLIVQHTFGQAARLDKILKIARQHNLLVIEDCAHSLGAEYQEQKLGSFAAASMFSFGRDKVISSVSGGMAATNNEKLAREIKKNHKDLPYPRYWNIFQNLLHPLAFVFINLTYCWFSLGKVILWTLFKIKFLAPVLSTEDKKGIKADYLPQRLPNALAKIANNQLRNLDKFNDHRIKIAQFYEQKLTGLKYRLPKILPQRKHIFLRYTIQTPEAEKIRLQARQDHIILGNWYNQVIAPNYIDLKTVKYQLGSCPQAEKAARESLNLPTHYKITFEAARMVLKVLCQSKI